MGSPFLLSQKLRALSLERHPMPLRSSVTTPSTTIRYLVWFLGLVNCSVCTASGAVLQFSLITSWRRVTLKRCRLDEAFRLRRHHEHQLERAVVEGPPSSPLLTLMTEFANRSA